MVGDRGLSGLPGIRGDYSFSGPQGETGATGKYRYFFITVYFVTRSCL